MKKILLIAAGCLAAWIIWEFFPGDERLILRRLDSLAALASVRENQPPLSRFATTERLRDFFDPAVVLNVSFGPYGDHSFNGRDELMEVVLTARSHLREMRFQFFDVTVEFSPDRKTATATMTASGDLNGEPNSLSQELIIVLKKTNGTWLIAQVDTVHPAPESQKGLDANRKIPPNQLGHAANDFKNASPSAAPAS